MENNKSEDKKSLQENTKVLNQITLLGMAINIILTILKFFAGFFGHSQVLIADAVHSLSDLTTDFALLIGVRFWNRPADSDHPHGHAKLETLVTFFIGIVLAGVGIGLIRSAILAIDILIGGEKLEAPGYLALVAALLSIILKEWIYQKTKKVALQVRSSAVMANAWHHRSDALSSIPAAIAVACCLIFGEKYAFLDPVGTIIVSGMIIYAALSIIRPAISTLLDHGASPEKIEEIRNEVLRIDEVKNVHKIRSRPLGSDKYAIDLHIHVDPNMTVCHAHLLSHRIQTDLCNSFEDVFDVVVHVEPYLPEDDNIVKTEIKHS